MGANAISQIAGLGQGAGGGAGANAVGGAGNQSQRSQVHQMVEQLRSEGVSQDQIRGAFQQAKQSHVSPLQTLSQLQQQHSGSGNGSSVAGLSVPGIGGTGVDKFTQSEA